MALETGKVATDLLISGVAKSNEPAMIVPNSPQGRPVREKSKDKEDDLEGLPADVAEVNALQAQFMADGNISIKEEITLKSRIAALKPRLDTWKKARDVVEKNNASGEYAIDDSGFTYIMNDKGKIERKHVSTVNKYDKKNMLTYGQLLDATFNKYAFDDNMLNAVGNAVTASMAQKKFIELIKQADEDSASATSGSGGVDSASGIKGWITSNKRLHKKWSAISEDRLAKQFSSLVRNMDARDRYALVLKGRLNYDDNEGLDNNDEAAVFESQMGWLGRSYEEENIESIHYTAPGVAASRKKNGDDDDSGLMTSSKLALSVLSDPNLSTDEFIFGTNGVIKLNVADALQTYNSSGTSSVTAYTLGQLLNHRGNMATDKMNFYQRDYIYIGDKKISSEQYDSIQIDGNNMKTTFIPFKDKKPDIELMIAVASMTPEGLPRDTMISQSNIHEIANKLNSYFNGKFDGKYDNVKIIDTNDVDDMNLVYNKTVDEAIASYFERNYTDDFNNATIAPCDICYATFSIGGKDGKSTFTENEVKKSLGLNNIGNIFTKNDDYDERKKNMILSSYKESITLANKERRSIEDFKEINDPSDIGRGLLILPHKTGVWARAFNIDYVQLEKSKRTEERFNKDKEEKKEGYEQSKFGMVKGKNQYTPLSN